MSMLNYTEIVENAALCTDRKNVTDFLYTANVNRQTTDKLLFSHAIITDENM